MTFDRKDYDDFMREKGQRQINGQRQNLEIMRQAAVKAELLTGDTHWDTFLSYLEAAKEAWEGECQTAIGMLKDPGVVDADEIMRLKIRVAQLEFGIGTIAGIISLPHDIKEQGEKAENLLTRLDG